MGFSRRSALAVASGLLASSATPLVAAASQLASAPRQGSAGSQRISHLVIHPDQSGGMHYFAPISFKAPDTAWASIGAMTSARFRAARMDYRLRGYGLRRLTAFQTRSGMRYAAIWQWQGAAPDHVAHDLPRDAFESTVARMTEDGHVVAHIDATATDAGPRFAALFEKGSPSEQRVLTGLTGTEYRARAAALGLEGFRPRQIAGYTDGGARFAAVFTRSPGQVEARHAIPASAFAAASRAMRAQGYELRDASGFVVRGKAYYSAVWEA